MEGRKKVNPEFAEPASTANPDSEKYVAEKVSEGTAQALKIKVDVAENFGAILADIRKRLLVPASLIDVEEKMIGENKVSISASYYGITVNGVLSRNGEKADCLVVYSQGHGGDPFRFQYHNVLRVKVLEQKCDVLSLSMLGLGLNIGASAFPAVLSDNNGWMSLNAEQAHFHENYALFYDKNNPGLDPISLLLSGNHAIISRVMREYSQVSMLGVSGGGWTTTLMSALIPEIQRSMSFAGSLPLFLRTFGSDRGDYEQVMPPLWRAYDYWHFYFLGQLDRNGVENRRVTLVYGNKDKCCFRDPQASIMKEIFDVIGGVQVLLVESTEHNVNPELAFNLIFEE